MIKTSGILPLTSWEVKCFDNTTTQDLTGCLSLVDVVSINQSDYIIYEGDSIEACLGTTLQCGMYYSVLSDGTNYFYSELFQVVDFDDSAYSQMPFALRTPFPWYNNQLKQNRFKAHCERSCVYKLITPSDALLPFMFKAPTILPITSWTLVSLDGATTITLDETLINIKTIGGIDYVYYNGDEIDNLECGCWESVITDGVNTWYSEVIQIIDVVSSTGYILTEDGAYVLQENTGLIPLEQQ